MPLYRGFKSYANAIALDLRREMGLQPHQPMNPFGLASHLDVPVYPLSALSAECGEAVAFFCGDGEDLFSAVTIFRGHHRFIVHNDAHATGRVSSNVVHELSHALLRHEPHVAISSEGCRHWDRTIEEEADWLAGTILVPEAAALHIASMAIPVDQAAEVYNVSGPMMRYRLNVTGAYNRIARAARYRRRAAG